MGCFPTFSVDKYPVKYLSRGGSKIWRRVSGRNSARYSLRQAFKKNEDFRSSKYKKIEPKKNVKENFELDQDTEQLEACDENNNNYQIQYDEQLVEVHPHSETSSDSEPNQTVIKDIAITNNNKNCEDQNEANFQTAPIEQETDCEYENKINGLLVTKSEYGSSEVDEEGVSKKTGKNNKYQKFKAKKPSCSSLNRISPDYDLINYSSINLEDLISGGSDSNSDNQSDKLTEVVKPSEPKKTDSISVSTSSEDTICASENKTDEIIAGTKIEKQNKIQPKNIVHQIPSKTSTLKKTDLTIARNIQENYFNMLSSIEFEETNSGASNGMDLDLVHKNTEGIINKKNIDETKESQSDISDSSSESHYFSCEEIKSEKSSPNSEELAANTDSSYESLPIGSMEKIDGNPSDFAIEENCDNQRKILSVQTSTGEAAIEESESSSHDDSEYIDVKIDEDSSDGKTNEPTKSIEIEKEIKSESSFNVVSDPRIVVNEESPDETDTKSIEIGNQINVDEQEENITQLSSKVHYEIDENITQKFSYVNLENLTETCIDSLSDIIDGRSILDAIEVESDVPDSSKSNHENNQKHIIESQIKTSEGFGGGNNETDEMNNSSEFEKKTGDSTAVKLVENEDNEPNGKLIEDVDPTMMKSHEPIGDEIEDTDKVNQKLDTFQLLPENSRAVNENGDAQTNLPTNHVESPKNYLNDDIINLFENSNKLQEKLTDKNNGGELKQAKTDVTSSNPEDKQLTQNLIENTEAVTPEEDNKQSQKNVNNIDQLQDSENSTNIQTEMENEKDNMNPANNQQNCQNAPTVKNDDIDEITPLKPNMVQPQPPKSDRRKKLLSFRLLGADDSFNKSSLMHLYDLMEQSHENLELTSTPTDEMAITRFIINTFEPSKPRRQTCKLVAVV